MQTTIELYKEIKKRSLKIAILVIPKTLGNDLPLVDSGFGLESCIDVKTNLKLLKG